ncbi:MAG: hypothetical protein GY755_18165 [Chloroflexi bacterium]|nr:hypothetical protein [Chloroflexota bacterium]
MNNTTSSLLVSFGGNTLKVHSNSPQVSTAIQNHLKHCHVDGQGTNLITELSVAVSDESTFTISEAGAVLFSGLNYDLTLQLLMTELISRLVAACDRGLMLHAATLSWQGSGLILSGQSGSGKSSLAAWLTADGFQYLTDEVIEIPLRENYVRGFPRSIFLKRGSAFIWQNRLPNKEEEGEEERFLIFKDGGVWIDPQLFHPNAVTATAVPRTLIFPHYQENAPLQTQKLTSAEALFHILQTLVNARNLPNHGLDAATRFVKRVAAYSLSYSNPEEASEWIKKTLQRA